MWTGAGTNEVTAKAVVNHFGAVPPWLEGHWDLWSWTEPDEKTEHTQRKMGHRAATNVQESDPSTGSGGGENNTALLISCVLILSHIGHVKKLTVKCIVQIYQYK